MTVLVKTLPETKRHEQSTRIIFRGGVVEIVVILVRFVANTTFVPLIGISKTSTAKGKLAPVNSSTGGIDCRSHLAARVCSILCIAKEFAARLNADHSADCADLTYP